MASFDKMQKTWIPEGTREYRAFKQITRENKFLAKFLSTAFELGADDLVLDVGGREGDVAYAIQEPSHVHIVDPDPSINPIPPPAQFLRCRIQEARLPEATYKLIICSHVLGYLSADHDQDVVINKLCKALAPGGSMILFYNKNSDYMGNLLEFALREIDKRHYDYFDEAIVQRLSSADFLVESKDVWFRAKYRDVTELSRACWFLFGGADQDIRAIAAKFQSKLTRDKIDCEMNIEQRITCIKKLA